MILRFFVYLLCCSLSFPAAHPLLEARLKRAVEEVESVPNEAYQEIFDNLMGFGEQYELDLVLGRRGNHAGEFLLPTSLELFNDEIYVTDFGNQRIQVFDLQGNFKKFLELPQLKKPVQIKFYQGQIYVVDQGSASIKIYNKNLALIKELGQMGVEDGDLNSPTALTIDPTGLVWVSDDRNNRLQVYVSDRLFGRDSNYFMGIDEYESEHLRAPKSVTWSGKNKSIYVIDSGTARVLSFDGYGNYIGPVLDYRKQEGKVFMPQSLDLDSQGSLYIADHISHRILKYSAASRPLGEIGHSNQFPSVLSIPVTTESTRALPPLVKTTGFLPEDSTLSFPMGIKVDDRGDVYVCDWGNNRIKKYSLSFFNKAYRYYQKQEFAQAIENFKRCFPRNEQYHLVEFYLAMCHYYLGLQDSSFEVRLEQFSKAKTYLDALKLKSEIGKFKNDWVRKKALYYLSRVESQLVN